MLFKYTAINGDGGSAFLSLNVWMNGVGMDKQEVRWYYWCMLGVCVCVCVCVCVSFEGGMTRCHVWCMRGKICAHMRCSMAWWQNGHYFSV